MEESVSEGVEEVEEEEEEIEDELPIFDAQEEAAWRSGGIFSGVGEDDQFPNRVTVMNLSKFD